MLDSLSLNEEVRFHYITQQDTKYGTAVPIAIAAPNIDEGESAVILMGDDFIYNPGGRNPIEHLISESSENSSLLGVNIPREDVSRYGVIEMSDDKHFVKIVEKPNVEDAPSTLINISKYVLSKDIIDMAVKFVETEKDGEYYITDVINEFVNNGGRVKVLEAVGEYLDGGNPSAWLHANRVVMGDIA